MQSDALYDEHVSWFETFRPELDDVERDCLERLLGAGSGRCLDLGCGTGIAIPVLVRLGWTVVGLDVSEAMLARAAEREGASELVRGSGESLPFSDASFDAVVSLWTHTDADDFAAMMMEAARVLRPGCPLVYVGAHPCFVGPHSRFIYGEGIPTLHPGYAATGRYFEGPAVGPDGLRARVGATHLPLGAFLYAFLDAGLELDAFEELGLGDPGRLFPYRLALRLRRVSPGDVARARMAG